MIHSLEATLTGLAQDILDCRPFGPIKDTFEPTIDEAVRGQSEADMMRLRLRHHVSAAPLGHYACLRAMALCQENLGHDLSSGNAYQDYIDQMVGVFKAAARQAASEIQMPGHPLEAAAEYCLQIRQAFGEQDESKVHKRGRVIKRDSLRSELAVGIGVPLTSNAKENTPSLVVTHAIGVCLSDGALPSAAVLAERAKQDIQRLERMSWPVSSVFRSAIFGAAAAREYVNFVRQHGRVPDAPVKWHIGLERFVAGAEDPFDDCSTLNRLLHGSDAPLYPSHDDGTPLQWGTCTGRVRLRPHTQEAQAKARDYFAAQGLPLGADGRFSAVRFQLAEGIARAEGTIYADQLCRQGLQAAADWVRQATQPG